MRYILVKVANYPLLYWWMNSGNIKSKQLRKEGPWDCKFGRSLIMFLLSFTLVSHIPYYIDFRFNNRRKYVMTSLGVILNNCFCRSLVLCMKRVYERCVRKWKTVLNFFVFWLLQRLCLTILTISLKVSFYISRRRSIDTMYAIKTNNFDSDIIRVQYFYF